MLRTIAVSSVPVVLAGVAAVHLAVCIKCHSGSQFALASLSPSPSSSLLLFLFLCQRRMTLMLTPAMRINEHMLRRYVRATPLLLLPSLPAPLFGRLSFRPLVRSFARAMLDALANAFAAGVAYFPACSDLVASASSSHTL